MKFTPKELSLLIVAVVLILWLSAIEGPVGAASHAGSHLVEDLQELPIHLYLAGIAILLWLGWNKLRKTNLLK